MSARLAVVSCTLDTDRALDCFNSWRDYSLSPIDYYIVEQGHGERDWEQVDVSAHGRLFRRGVREILGVVPAFALGVVRALHDGAPIIACLHDDLLIEQQGWDENVVRLFKACPRAGLLGFGGAKGLGSDDLYRTPYNPMQLARQGFRSNMRDAEAHGLRSEFAVPVACLDGFSQIGLAKFWRGEVHPQAGITIPPDYKAEELFSIMEEWGVVHHFYDGMLGCFAKRLGWQVWYLPIRCHHFGGRTAVGDTRYQEWINATLNSGAPGGDQVAWAQAHAIGYEQFRDCLPIRT